jgi:hypothetical protein
VTSIVVCRLDFRRPTVYFQARRYSQDTIRVIVTRDQSASSCSANDKLLEEPRMMARSVDWEPQGGALKVFCQWGVPFMTGSPKVWPQYVDFGQAGKY